MFVKTNNGPHRVGGSLRLVPAHYTPQPQSNKYAFNRRLAR